MRQHLVTVIAVAVTATAVSFAIAQASSSPPTAQSSATDRQVVKQLRDLNRNVRGLHRAIGVSPVSGWRAELSRKLYDTNAKLDSISDGIAESETMLGRICRNARETITDSC